MRIKSCFCVFIAVFAAAVGKYLMSTGKGSHDKGKAGERELCKLLADIFGGSFVRSAGSGAFIGGKNRFRKTDLSAGQTRTFKADITPPDSMPRLVIEAKWYKDFRFHQLLQAGGHPQLDEWIAQTLDVIDAGDLWYVAFKINLRGWYVAVAETLCEGHSFANYAVYQGAYGRFRVTELVRYFRDNRAAIAQRSAPSD